MENVLAGRGSMLVHANAMYCPCVPKNTYKYTLSRIFITLPALFSIGSFGSLLGPDPPCMGGTKPASHMLGHHVLKNKGF